MTRLTEPTEEQIQQFVNLAADLPPEDIVRTMYIVQAQGTHTPGAKIIRRAIAEIISLRAALRVSGRAH